MSLYSSFNSSKKAGTIRNILIMLFLLFFALVSLFPIYFMIGQSFGDPVEAGAATFSLLPRKFSLGSYAFFFDYSKYSVRWLLNSLIVASLTTLANVVFAAMAGYSFAKMKFKGQKWIFSILLIAMMIPYQVTQVPLYILMVNIFELNNTYTALIAPGLCTVYNVFLTKQFMASIPTSLIESAKIEGCNQPQIFIKIIVPLSKTILAVMAITTFMNTWNTFFWPLLVTDTMEMQTIQVGLKNFRFANTTYFSPMMAGATISALPMFVLFFSLQKYFLEGVTVGAVKG